jgi:hypothetical protein
MILMWGLSLEIKSGRLDPHTRRSIDMPDDPKDVFRAIADAYAAKVEASKSSELKWHKAAEEIIKPVLKDAESQFTSSGRTIGAGEKDGEIFLAVIGLKGGVQTLSYRLLVVESQVIVTEKLDSGTKESEIPIENLSRPLIVSHAQVFLEKALKVNI